MEATFFADLENLEDLTLFCTFILWSVEFTVLTAKGIEVQQPFILEKLSRETRIVKDRLL